MKTSESTITFAGTSTRGDLAEAFSNAMTLLKDADLKTVNLGQVSVAISVKPDVRDDVADVSNRGIKDDVGNRGIKDDVGNRGIKDDVGNRGIKDDVGNRGIKDDVAIVESKMSKGR
jgi:hypothetical protein